MLARIACVAAVLVSLVWFHQCVAQTAMIETSGDVAAYVVDPGWPQKPSNLRWGAVPGIAVDAKDQVYVFTRSKSPVQVYASDGRFLRSWKGKGIVQPHQIRIDGQGNIWLADIGTHTVQKYTAEGKLLLVLGTAGRAGCDATHFNKPTDMVVLQNGDIFVSDGYENRRVVHFDRAGKYVKAWGEEGTEPGKFGLPHSIVADAKNRIYVADRRNARIQVFDTNGKVLDAWNDLVTPWGLAVTDGDEIWVCGSSPVERDKKRGWVVGPPPDQLVMKLSPEGKVLLRVPLPKIAEPPGKAGEVDWVHGIALDSKRNIYLGDIMGKRVQKYKLKIP